MQFFKRLFGDRYATLWSPEHHRAIVENPTEITSQYDCIVSHRPFGDHVRFDRPVTYVSMVRDPIDRLVSYYNYVRSKPDHYDYALCTSMGLNDWAHHWLTRTPQNILCHYLANAKTYDAAAASCLNNYALIADVTEIDDFFQEFVAMVGKTDAGARRVPHANRSEGEHRSSLSQDVLDLAAWTLAEDFKVVDLIKSDLV